MYQVGDFIKYECISKSGRPYYIHGIILHKDDSLKRTFSQFESQYTILTEDNDEVNIRESKIEEDKESEREYKLKQFFNNENKDDNYDKEDREEY